MPRIVTGFALLFTGLLLGGCASYIAPGGPANFSRLGLTKKQVDNMSNYDVATALNKKPLVTFPASIAVVHVQAADYNNNDRQYSGPASGEFRVVGVRQVESAKEFRQLQHLAHVRGVAPISRMLLPAGPLHFLSLRIAAAKMHANLLLCYTFNTRFTTHSLVKPLSIITLGVAPDKNARVTSTASAVLLDVRDGYIYGAFESTRKGNQLANAWTKAQAVDQVRRRTEREALRNVENQFVKRWPDMIATYDRPAHSVATLPRKK